MNAGQKFREGDIVAHRGRALLTGTVTRAFTLEKPINRLPSNWYDVRLANGCDVTTHEVNLQRIMRPS